MGIKKEYYVKGTKHFNKIIENFPNQGKGYVEDI